MSEAPSTCLPLHLSENKEIIIIENYFSSPSSTPSSPVERISITEEFTTISTNEQWLQGLDADDEATAAIKRRLRSTWNNAKYNNKVSRWILKRRSSFDKDQPVWLLGKMYSWQSNAGRRHSITKRSDSSAYDDAYRAFIADFTSRIWFTYRKDFAKLNGCRLKSDCGWGCMLRCGQMLLAQALVCHILGRDWTQSHDKNDPKKLKLHRDIVQWFLDCPKRPFSLHRLVELGLQYGKRGGEWYGPGSTALILRDALSNRQCSPHNDSSILDTLAMYVASDGILYLDELQRCFDQPSQGAHSDLESDNGLFTLPKSLLLIIPLRLGVDKFNPLYVDHLKTVLSLKSCVGIVGGRPRHSMYFVGWQGNSLIYLDPHYCQDAIEFDQMADLSLSTFHCKWPRKILFADIDPSCAVGFYLHSGTNLVDFVNDLTGIVEYRKSGGPPLKSPLFSVLKRRDSMDVTAEERIICLDDSTGRRRSSSKYKREYVFL